MSNPASTDAEVTAPASNETSNVKVEGARGEVSAHTIARLMGLSTHSDLKLIEGKLDLIVSRLGTVSARLEKISGLVQQAPTGTDMERIDVQIGTLRSSMRELLLSLKVNAPEVSGDAKELLDNASKELDSLPEGFEEK